MITPKKTLCLFFSFVIALYVIFLILSESVPPMPFSEHQSVDPVLITTPEVEFFLNAINVPYVSLTRNPLSNAINSVFSNFRIELSITG